MSKRENQTRGKPDVIGLRRSHSGQNQTQNQTGLFSSHDKNQTRRSRSGSGFKVFVGIETRQTQTGRTRQKPDEGSLWRTEK